MGALRRIRPYRHTAREQSEYDRVFAELTADLDDPVRESVAAGAARSSGQGGTGGSGTLSDADIPDNQAEIQPGKGVALMSKSFAGPEFSGLVIVGIVVAVVVAVLAVLAGVWLALHGFPLLVSIAPGAMVPVAVGFRLCAFELSGSSLRRHVDHGVAGALHPARAAAAA
jgi:hypothetical protein